MPGVRMGVNGAADARALQRRLRAAAAGGLQRELERQLRSAGRPVVLALKAEIMAMPTFGSKSTGLRAKIAGATRQAPRIGGVRFYVATGALGSQGVLPEKIEAGAGWWHPVFGRPPYVHQNSWPWFQRTVSAHEGDLRDAVEQAMQRVANMIG